MIFFGRRGPYLNSLATRQAILEAVRQAPGASLADIIRLTGLSWGATSHHLRGLVGRGELRQITLGRRKYYCGERDQPGLLPFMRLLRTEPEVTDVLRVLNRNGPASILRLSQELGMDRKTIRRHVAAMMEAGMVGLTPTARPRLELRSLPLLDGQNSLREQLDRTAPGVAPHEPRARGPAHD